MARLRVQTFSTSEACGVNRDKQQKQTTNK